VKGASTAGIVTIGVSKTPGKNEFFRTHPEFRPVVPMVNCEVGMEKHYFAVTDPMIEALASIGIAVNLHTLYLTVTSRGAVRIVPVRQADNEGNQSEYDRTREIGLLAGREQWVRIYTDLENRAYQSISRTQGPFRRPGVVRSQASKNLSARIQRERSADR
jgi:hypothetical protein